MPPYVVQPDADVTSGDLGVRQARTCQAFARELRRRALRLDANHVRESSRQRKREQTYAGIKFQRCLTLGLSNRGVDQLRHQTIICLEEALGIEPIGFAVN